MIEYCAIIIGGIGGAVVLFAAIEQRVLECLGWFFTAGLFGIILVFTLAGCTTVPQPTKADALRVSVADKKMEVLADGRKLREYPVKLARNGIGNRLGSGKTPLGEFTITKEPSHRFGKVFRLSGFQGHRRGILIHRGNGRSRGCIHLAASDLAELFPMVQDGARLNIF